MNFQKDFSGFEPDPARFSGWDDQGSTGSVSLVNRAHVVVWDRNQGLGLPQHTRSDFRPIESVFVPAWPVLPVRVVSGVITCLTQLKTMDILPNMGKRTSGTTSLVLGRTGPCSRELARFQGKDAPGPFLSTTSLNLPRFAILNVTLSRVGSARFGPCGPFPDQGVSGPFMSKPFM